MNKNVSATLFLFTAIVLSLFLETAGNASTCEDNLIEKISGIVAKFNPDDFYWKFPSDHLPVTGTATLTKTEEAFVIVSWNVLNTNYMDHIIRGTQGLKYSEITQSTNRSLRLVEVLSDLVSGVAPDLIGLQEVDGNFLRLLGPWCLENGFAMHVAENPSRGSSPVAIDYGVILFKPERLRELDDLGETVIFSGNSKYIQQAGFQSPRGEKFIFANVHRNFVDHQTLPDYLLRYLSLPYGEPRIVLGDMNLDRPAMEELIRQMPGALLLEKYPGAFSHIDTSRQLSDFDHIIFMGNVFVQRNPNHSLEALRHFSLPTNSSNVSGSAPKTHNGSESN